MSENKFKFSKLSEFSELSKLSKIFNFFEFIEIITIDQLLMIEKHPIPGYPHLPT